MHREQNKSRQSVSTDGMQTHPAGQRPIGIGEVLRRIIGKIVVHILRKELQEDAGDLQMCVGIEGGCEAGVHDREWHDRRT